MRDWIEWYSERALWSKLYRTGTNPIARLSMLVPVFGFLLLHIPGLGGVRMLLLYYGCTILGVGTLVYSWKHSRVAKYESASDFYTDKAPYFANTETVKQLLSALAKSTARTPMMNSDTVAYHTKPGAAEPTAGALPALLGAYWETQNRAYPKWRFISQALFDIGSIILAIPVLMTLFDVLAMTVRLIAK